MRYAHFAEICEICGNMRNMWQSHIRVKLTCLARQDQTLHKISLIQVDCRPYRLSLRCAASVR